MSINITKLCRLSVIASQWLYSRHGDPYLGSYSVVQLSNWSVWIKRLGTRSPAICNATAIPTRAVLKLCLLEIILSERFNHFGLEKPITIRITIIDNRSNIPHFFKYIRHINKTTVNISYNMFGNMLDDAKVKQTPKKLTCFLLQNDSFLIQVITSNQVYESCNRCIHTKHLPTSIY